MTITKITIIERVGKVEKSRSYEGTFSCENDLKGVLMAERMVGGPAERVEVACDSRMHGLSAEGISEMIRANEFGLLKPGVTSRPFVRPPVRTRKAASKRKAKK